jgi:hypothetical protein
LDDDAPTDLGAAAVRRVSGGAAAGESDLPTDLGYNAQSGGAGAAGAVEDVTDISAERQGMGGPRRIDLDEVVETEIGRSRVEDRTEIEFAVTGTLGILWMKSGNRRGQIYHIKDGTVVGRKKGGLVLDDPKISDPHAKFTVEEDGFVVWDFGSTNGTYVNGKRIRGATDLKEGDEIKMGEMVFVLKILPDPYDEDDEAPRKTKRRSGSAAKG